MNRTRKKRKKTHAKLVKEPQSSMLSSQQNTDKMAGSKGAQTREKQKSDSQRSHRRASSRTERPELIYDKMDLARNYYWCDELDYHRMHPPVRELLAFANSDYSSPEDVLLDVLNFFPRIKSAQKHAISYLRWRGLIKITPKT